MALKSFDNAWYNIIWVTIVLVIITLGLLLWTIKRPIKYIMKELILKNKGWVVLYIIIIFLEYSSFLWYPIVWYIYLCWLKNV